MIAKGKYFKNTNFSRLTNQRCNAKGSNKSIIYRNNWCDKEGDCSSCYVAKRYEEWLEEH